MTITGLAGVGPIDLVAGTLGIHQKGSAAVGGGVHIQKAEIKLFQPGTQVLSRRYVLSDLIVSSYALAVETGANEHLALGYKRIEQFVPGTGGTESKACWDLAEAKAC